MFFNSPAATSISDLQNTFQPQILLTKPAAWTISRISHGSMVCFTILQLPLSLQYTFQRQNLLTKFIAAFTISRILHGLMMCFIILQLPLSLQNTFQPQNLLTKPAAFTISRILHGF